MGLELRPGADVRDARLEEEVERLLFLSESRLLRRGKGFTVIGDVAILLS